MASLAGSELFFTLDSQSCSFENDSIFVLEDDMEVKPSAQLRLSAGLAQALSPTDGSGVEETVLQRTVQEQMLKCLKVQQLLLPHEDAHGSGSRYPAAAVTLRELCLALRLHKGLDARLFAPVPLSGPGCGRQSTGGGGQCATGGAGRRCFFCSRQPYAMVRCLSSYGEEAGQQQQQQQQQQEAVAGSGASDGAPQPAPPVVLVVEPSLRELFRIAPSTPEYAALVEALPQVWVGPRAALLDLAGRMCDAMAINFRSQRLDIPPWRRRTAVLSRWDQQHYHEMMHTQPEGREGPEREVEGKTEGEGEGPPQPLGPAPGPGLALRGVEAHASGQQQQRQQQADLQGTCQLHASGGAPAAAPAGPTSLHTIDAIRSAGAGAYTAEGADVPPPPGSQNKKAAAAASPSASAAAASGQGTCSAAAAAMLPVTALPAVRLGGGARCASGGCCGCEPAPPVVVVQREGRPTRTAAGTAPAPPVIVYGFDLPGPARAV